MSPQNCHFTRNPCFVREALRKGQQVKKKLVQFITFIILYCITILPFQKKSGSCMEVRLNSPRGKFKITNMADDQVDLTPEDIFGASFIEKEI